MNKICVFDLDGTLWKVNSHLDIVYKYYSYNRFMVFFDKIWRKLFYSSNMKYIDKLYKKIPLTYKENYNPDFRKDCMNLLKESKYEYDDVLIISTAPLEILANVRKRMDIPVIQSPAGKKYDTLKRNMKIGIAYLCVVTDNVSDRDLIEHADKAIIYSNKIRKRKFMEFSLPDKTIFKDEKLD